MDELNKEPVLIELINLARRNRDVAALWLYGSRSKGTSHKSSDYDLAVLFISRVEDPLERRLRPELLALSWAKELELEERDISVIDIQVAPVPLVMNAISGKLLYCGDHSARYVAEGIIMSKAELDYLHHSKYN